MSAILPCHIGKPAPSPRIEVYARLARRGLLMLATAAALALSAAQAAQPAGLSALSLEQLLEVRIVGASKYEQRQSEVAAAASVITRQEIRAFGWRTLAEALASLPGMHTTYDRQYTYLGTRGFGLPGDLNTRVLLTINGNRVNDPTYDGGPAGREFPLDIDLVERIEYIPGPGGAVYGQNAMFGVVNVITRPGSQLDGGEATISYQHPDFQRAGRLSWGKLLDNGLDVVFSLSGLRSRGDNRFFDYPGSGSSGVATGLDGERDQKFFGRVARGPWSFDLLQSNRTKSDPTGSFFSDPLTSGQFVADRYALAQLQYQDKFAADTLHLTGRLFAGSYRFRSNLSFGTGVSFPAEAEWRGLELRLLSTAIAGHKLLAGIEAQDNSRTDQATLDHANPANDVVVRKSGYRIAFYAQDEWQIADSLSATLGFRLDRNDVTGTQVSPRAGLIWRTLPETTLKALYGRANRAPNAFESGYDDGLTLVRNASLGSERVDTFELVVDHRVSRELTVRGALYHWTMHDLITLGTEPASGLPQYQSGGKVMARGIELSADKIWRSGARLRVSLSAQHAVNAGGDQTINAPRLLGKLNWSAPLPIVGLLAGYELRYDSRRLTLDGTQSGGYSVSNLHLRSETLLKGLEVSLGIYNLFDKRYAQPGTDTNWQNTLEQDGRSVRVKLSAKF
jgi:outer membrane receptor protein involved in Fe transport